MNNPVKPVRVGIKDTCEYERFITLTNSGRNIANVPPYNPADRKKTKLAHIVIIHE